MNYSSSTLMGNWQEDKSTAAPLHGGIPDLGFREYSVSYRDDFRAPPPGASVTFKRRPDRYGMVCKATVTEAAFAMGPLPTGEEAAGARRAGFDLTLGGGAKLPTRDDTIAQYRTTTQDALEAGAQLGREAAIRAARELATVGRTVHSKAAGGAPSVNIDRGKHTAGISGEILNLDKDARKNTVAQRSWMNAPDPGLKFTMAPAAPRPEVTGLSLNIRGVPPSASIKEGAPMPAHGRYAAFQAESRKSTDVTAAVTGVSNKPGRRVFIDDP